MRSLSPRASWLLAGMSGLAAGVTLLAEGRAWWLAAATTMWLVLSTWAVTRRPWLGVLITAAATVVLTLHSTGAQDSGAMLLPSIIVLAVTGYLLRPAEGLGTVVVLYAALIIRGPWHVGSLLFALVLLLGPWSFGVLVQRRDTKRRKAAAEAQRLSLIDSEEQGRQAALLERETVVTTALEMIGHGVQDMTATTAIARRALDLTAIEDVHRIGADVTGRLRALLMVLREHTDDLTTDTQEKPSGSTQVNDRHPGRTLVVGLLRTWWPVVPLILLAALIAQQPALDGETIHRTEPGIGLVLVVAALAASLAARNRYTVAALLASATCLLLGNWAGVLDLSWDLQWICVASLALSWAAGRAGTRRAAVAWLILLTSTLVPVISADLWDSTITVVLHVLPFIAGYAWFGHHSSESVHRLEAQHHQATIEDAAARAVAAERLELARDLHDAASHAVGTMMMQASASRVLRERDPAAARAALDAIIDVGRTATEELQAMTRRLPPLPATTLTRLITAAEQSGVRVRTATEDAARLSAADTELVLRVVREGLTNATRHAPGSDVLVRVALTADQVVTEVSNGPARARSNAWEQDPAGNHSRGSGLGLLGLGELVGARAGVLQAEPTADGGFRLTAEFAPHLASVQEVGP